MKFGIGTAQIKQNYGIVKKKTILKDLKKVFKRFDEKIDLIDTAPSYGPAEKIIGEYNCKKYKIVTKLNKIKSKKINEIIKEINLNLKSSLNNLKTNSIYCLMLHSESDIKILKFKKIKLLFNELKKEKKINKVGISIYNLENLDKYLKVYNFDVVQIPLNIFSMRKNLIKYLLNLKKINKFELHVRSIFFQGIIFLKPKKIPKKLNFINKKLKLVNDISKKFKSNIYDFAISSVANLKLADYVIIGVSNFKEYSRILKFKKIHVNKNQIRKILLKKSLTDLSKLT